MFEGILYMPQLHFYVPNRVAERLREEAAAEGMTLSRYIGTVVGSSAAGNWPEGFFEEVVGGWKGRPLHRPPQGGLRDA